MLRTRWRERGDTWCQRREIENGSQHM